MAPCPSMDSCTACECSGTLLIRGVSGVDSHASSSKSKEADRFVVCCALAGAHSEDRVAAAESRAVAARAQAAMLVEAVEDRAHEVSTVPQTPCPPRDTDVHLPSATCASIVADTTDVRPAQDACWLFVAWSCASAPIPAVEQSSGTVLTLR